MGRRPEVRLHLAALTFSGGSSTGPGWLASAQTTVVTTETHAVTGTSGIDTLVGTAGADLFDGKGGNDIEEGAGGYDTYLFNAGYGTLQIVNGGGSTTVPAGQLTLGLGLEQTDLWFIHSGNNLTIDELGTTQSVTVDNWFANPLAQLNEIMGGDGAWLNNSAVAPLVSAMAAYQAANPSFNPTTTGTTMSTDATLHGAIVSAWHT